MKELDDLRLARDDAVNMAKETEKKLKALEADSLHFHEVQEKQKNRTKINLTGCGKKEVTTYSRLGLFPPHLQNAHNTYS